MACKDRVMTLPGREPDNGVREITITPMTSRAKAERAAGTGCSARNTAPRITRYPSIRYRDRGGGRARDNPHILASSTPFVKKTKERREAERARRHLHMQLSGQTCSSRSSWRCATRCGEVLAATHRPPSQRDYVPDFHIADMGLSWRTGSRPTCVVLPPREAGV